MAHPSFTTLLQHFIDRRDLPVERLATLADMPRKTLYRWTGGQVKRPRDWIHIVNLARALRLSEIEANQLLQAARHPTLRELQHLAESDYDRQQLDSFLSEQRQQDAPYPHIPPPTPSPDPWSFLEAPAGAVRPDSPFYIERVADEKLARQLNGGGTTTTIQAGRQTGKTSLLMQGIRQVKLAGAAYVYLDFQIIEEDDLKDLASLLRYIASAIAEQLDLAPELSAESWETAHSPVRLFNRYLQGEVLPAVDGPILLAIDEADRLLDVPYKQAFFALLRAWDSRRAYDDLWRKLNLVLVISTHPYLLIDDVNISPFNVGLTIHLQDFDAGQVAELNIRHGTPLPAADIPALMALVGGHPYLVRQALYTLVSEKMTLNDLQEQAIHPQGPFGKHLRFYRQSLERSPDLQQAMAQIVRGKNVDDLDETVLDRLAAVGLVVKSPAGWEPRCGLYRQYFQEQLA